PDIRFPPAARSRAGFDCRYRHFVSRLSPAQPASGIIIYGSLARQDDCEAIKHRWAKNRLARIGQLRLNATKSLRGKYPLHGRAFFIVPPPPSASLLPP